MNEKIAAMLVIGIIVSLALFKMQDGAAAIATAGITGIGSMVGAVAARAKQ